MKTEETHRWRINWLGRDVTTRYQATEAHIRIEHPEAVKVPGTLVLRQVPETEEERDQLRYRR